MLTAVDVLPFRPDRVLVAGVTGAGKTTMARRIHEHWGIRCIELDALFHGPNWVPRPQFLDDVRAFSLEDRWVTEWQYTSNGTTPLLAPRAQLVVWLDYPYRVVRSRLIRRSVLRSILRTRLWNGNVEEPLWRWFSKPEEEDLLKWQTATLHTWEERMPHLQAEYPHLAIVRLRHPRDVDRWFRANPAG